MKFNFQKITKFKINNGLNRYNIWKFLLNEISTRIGTYGVTKNNPSGNFLTIYWIQTQYILLLGEQVLTIFLCIKRVRLNRNFIVNDVQSVTYSSNGAPCPVRDLFPWLNTRMKVHISPWTIRKYPKRPFPYLSDSGDTFLLLSSPGEEEFYNCMSHP